MYDNQRKRKMKKKRIDNKKQQKKNTKIVNNRLHQLLLTVFKTSWFISTLPNSLNSRAQHVSR